jgi:hypothetical protein
MSELMEDFNERPLDIFRNGNVYTPRSYFMILDNRKLKYLEVKRFVHDDDHVGKNRRIFASGSEDFIVKELLMYLLVEELNIGPKDDEKLSYVDQYTAALSAETSKKLLELASWFTIIQYKSDLDTSKVHSIDSFIKHPNTSILQRLDPVIRIKRILRERLVRSHIPVGTSKIHYPLERATERNLKSAIGKNRVWVLSLRHDHNVKSWKTLNAVGVTQGSLIKLDVPNWFDTKSYFCFSESDINLLRLGFSTDVADSIEITDIINEIDNWKLI